MSMKNEETQKQKLSQKTWFIILWLIVFFPVGLFFMWKSSWNKIVKIVISVIFAIALVSAIASPSTSSDMTATTTHETIAATEEQKQANPIMEYAINEADVKNGTGTEVIGKWANIEISKKELKEYGQENFVEFVKSKL